MENNETVQTSEIEEINQPEVIENNQDTSEQELSFSEPVTSLDDAKKVLEAQAKKSKTKTANEQASKNNTNTEVDYKKQYEEIQKVIGKQSKELGQLRKFYQENQQVINAYKQYLEQQQEAELAEKAKTDPVGVLRELAKREALQQVAPYQEQITTAQATTINNSIREQLGSEYDTYAPVMADLLDEFIQMDEANGSTYATELAQNPHILMQMAAGKVALQQKAQNAQQQQVAQVKKANNLKVAGGVGRGNTTVSSPTGDFRNLSLDEMRQALKKQGIIQ